MQVLSTREKCRRRETVQLPALLARSLATTCRHRLQIPPETLNIIGYNLHTLSRRYSQQAEQNQGSAMHGRFVWGFEARLLFVWQTYWRGIAMACWESSYVGRRVFNVFYFEIRSMGSCSLLGALV